MEKKTDLERFVELYKSFGVELESEIINYGEGKKEIHIVIEAGSNEKIGGYNGFGTSVVFDLDGKFLGQGFWE